LILRKYLSDRADPLTKVCSSDARPRGQAAPGHHARFTDFSAVFIDFARRVQSWVESLML
jgi:hypothetical protein